MGSRRAGRSRSRPCRAARRESRPPRARRPVASRPPARRARARERKRAVRRSGGDAGEGARAARRSAARRRGPRRRSARRPRRGGRRARRPRGRSRRRAPSAPVARRDGARLVQRVVGDRTCSPSGRQRDARERRRGRSTRSGRSRSAAAISASLPRLAVARTSGGSEGEGLLRARVAGRGAGAPTSCAMPALGERQQLEQPRRGRTASAPPCPAPRRTRPPPVITTFMSTSAPESSR